ncbi:transposase [Nitrospira sp. BLG_2]|uniref:transposase n=1 Tax=Nitrospira sp. BLG_2 TaxID=3397507 RepID=UPI003B9C35BD
MRVRACSHTSRWSRVPAWLAHSSGVSPRRPPSDWTRRLPHHVIQRGNNRQPVFLAPKAYQAFVECLLVAKQQCRVRLHASVLMTNHIHLLMEPEHEGDLSRFMQSVGRRYFRYFNADHERTGPGTTRSSS